MPLVRAWTRGLSGASGAAVLVPGGIIAALLLLALAGSFGRIGGLGQAFSGPAAPGSPRIASSLASPPAHGPALLPVAAASARQPVLVAARLGAAAGAAGGSGHAGGHSGGTGGGSPTGGGGGTTAPPGSPSAPGGGPTCSTSCTQPQPPPTLVDRVVSLGTSITSKLPGAVGQLTTQLLKQVGATVDRILPTDRRANVVTQLGSTLSQIKLP
jgi:hypothetical protein